MFLVEKDCPQCLLIVPAVNKNILKTWNFNGILILCLVPVQLCDAHIIDSVTFCQDAVSNSCLSPCCIWMVTYAA